MRMGETNIEINSIHVSDNHVSKLSHDVPVDVFGCHHVLKVSRSSNVGEGHEEEKTTWFSWWVKAFDYFCF